MSIKITTTDEFGKRVTTELDNNVFSGYTISSEGVYKTEDGPKKGRTKSDIPSELIPNQIEITAETVTENEFVSFFNKLFKQLIKYVNKKNKV